MKLKNANASSKKTIDLIKKTFAELMEEKREISSITVVELVKRAGITRGTFYAHYENIYDVANEFQEELLGKVLNERVNISSKNDLHAYLDSVFEYIEDNKKIYTKLLASNEAILFMSRLDKKICSFFAERLENGKDKNLNISFFASGTIALIIQYFKNQTDMDLEYIKNYTTKLAEYIFFN